MVTACRRRHRAGVLAAPGLHLAADLADPGPGVAGQGRCRGLAGGPAIRPVEAAHGLLESERAAIIDLATAWEQVDLTHRKLAHRGSRLGTVYL